MVFRQKEMFKKLWFRVFLILISVSALALSSALVVRELMVRDFRGYLEGEVEDRASWITTSLESTFEKYSVWPNPEIVENTIWALMLGFEMKLYDADGSFIIDTDSAVNILSSYVKKRIVAISSLRYRDETSGYQPHALFLSGREIGRVELRFLRSQKELFFIKRSNRLLIISLLGMGGAAVLLSIIFSKRLITPVEQLTRAVTDIAEGNLTSRSFSSRRCFGCGGGFSGGRCFGCSGSFSGRSATSGKNKRGDHKKAESLQKHIVLHLYFSLEYLRAIDLQHTVSY